MTRYTNGDLWAVAVGQGAGGGGGSYNTRRFDMAVCVCTLI